MNRQDLINIGVEAGLTEEQAIIAIDSFIQHLLDKTPDGEDIDIAKLFKELD